MKDEMTRTELERAEYDEVHRLLSAIQYEYPSLTLDELHEIFDETFERLERELD